MTFFDNLAGVWTAVAAGGYVTGVKGSATK